MRCVLCTKEEFVTVYRPPDVGDRALRRCDGCGLVQMQPMPTTPELAEYYQRYDVLGEREPYYRLLWGPGAVKTPEGRDIKHRFNWMRKHLPGMGSVLDIGSGPGLFLRLVKEAGGEAVGVELNARAAVASAKELGVNVFAGTIESVPARRYDAITLWDLIEHVNDPGETVRRCHALLGEGGQLFIETPNEAALLDWAVRVCAKVGFMYPANTFYGMHHLVLFRPKTIKQLLERNGFTVTEIRAAHTTVRRVFRGNGIKDRIMRLALGVLFIAARILRRQNKMLVAARKI